MPRTSRRRLARRLAGVPLLAIAAALVYLAATEMAGRVAAPTYQFDTTVQTAATVLGATALACLPLLWIGVRTLDGETGVLGRTGAYCYAVLLVVASFVFVFSGSSDLPLDAAPLPPAPTLVAVTLVGTLAGLAGTFWLSIARRSFPALGVRRTPWALGWHPWLLLPLVVLLWFVGLTLLFGAGGLTLLVLVPLGWLGAAGYVLRRYGSVVEAFGEWAGERADLGLHRAGTAEVGTVLVGEQGYLDVGWLPLVRRLVATAVVVEPDGVRIEDVALLHLPTLSVTDLDARRRIPTGAVETVTHERGRLTVSTPTETVVVPCRERPDELLSALEARASGVRPGGASRQDLALDGDPDRGRFRQVPTRRAALAGAGVVAVAVLGGVVAGRGLPTDTSVYGYGVADFQFDYGASTGRLTVTHVGGDRFDPGNTGRLLVVADDVEHEWSLPVSAGDETTLPVDPGTTVRVVWEARNDGRRRTIEAHDVRG